MSYERTTPLYILTEGKVAHTYMKLDVSYNIHKFSLLCNLILRHFVFCLQLIDKTCTSPTPTLEQHLMWDDIAILARYLLMLSFNNSLDGRASGLDFNHLFVIVLLTVEYKLIVKKFLGKAFYWNFLKINFRPVLFWNMNFVFPSQSF